MNSTLSLLLSFYYRSTTENGNTRRSLACLPRYHAATRQDMALSLFIPPYRFTSQTCYRQHCVYSFHKSYARGYYTTPNGFGPEHSVRPLDPPAPFVRYADFLRRWSIRYRPSMLDLSPTVQWPLHYCHALGTCSILTVLRRCHVQVYNLMD